MSGAKVPADISGHMLDLDEEEDLEVFSKTTRSEFDSSEYEVRRRYQDFLWLKSRLEENYPTLIVHPLPEKFVMKSMVERFNDDFIETRRKALHRFLNRITEHPILSCSHHFKVFLTEEELAPHRKLGPGFLSRMSETMRAMANSVRGLRSKLEEFAIMQEYVDDFSNNMCSVDKVTHRITKEHREYMDELKQYGPTYFQWAESEELLAEPLKGVGSCVEKCSKETEEQIQYLSEVLVPTLHEYVLCADTLKAVMKRRDNIQAEFEAKNEALASKTTDKEMLQEEVDDLADRVEQANNALRGDWSRWRTSMRADLKSAFISTAAKNVDYYEKCLAVWESFLLSQRGESMEQRNGADAS
ncbi:sorting nexin-7 isoform X3 [Xiphophorus hellerii]|uniref:sorting nexin-7 isoform X3 n=1 Tax=Xiphophorus hellerii TaxID=8084 RepID=UPI0013B3A10F|nr:sorting nexin-7 isoform X3 [Xiphophorus hellerii]